MGVTTMHRAQDAQGPLLTPRPTNKPARAPTTIPAGTLGTTMEPECTPHAHRRVLVLE